MSSSTQFIAGALYIHLALKLENIVVPDEKKARSLRCDSYIWVGQHSINEHDVVSCSISVAANFYAPFDLNVEENMVVYCRAAVGKLPSENIEDKHVFELLLNNISW
jgi:hypothetical protein